VPFGTGAAIWTLGSGRGCIKMPRNTANKPRGDEPQCPISRPFRRKKTPTALDELVPSCVS
jgi:hypothetical protein